MRKLKTPEFQAPLEAAPDAMVIIDRDGIILQINAQAEKLFGYQRNELLGKQVEILIPDRFRQAHPAHRKRYFIASHELKTPLTALLMQVDAILRLGTSRSNPPQPALSDTVIARVQKIRQGTRRLNKLIDQLLDLSRI